MSFRAAISDFFRGFFTQAAAHINPPLYECADAMEALQRAKALGTPYHTTGTPSMVPVIPARPCMLAVKEIPFADAQLGTIVGYQPKWSPDNAVTHRLVSKDRLGFIAEGDNEQNRPETWERVTADNFLGEVVAIFTFPS